MEATVKLWKEIRARLNQTMSKRKFAKVENELNGLELEQDRMSQASSLTSRSHLRTSSVLHNILRSQSRWSLYRH